MRRDALTVAGRAARPGARFSNPLYAVSAEDDHIAPWRQTFRINSFVMAPKRYVLSSSGHILGIVNPPVSPPQAQVLGRYRSPRGHRRRMARTCGGTAGFLVGGLDGVAQAAKRRHGEGAAADDEGISDARGCARNLRSGAVKTQPYSTRGIALPASIAEAVATRSVA
ncbi:MAG: hypothetical protein MZW92_51615 [Comamonadaceae bacterium]|nr:hypothetical protein [Comamonadaceae bacterium]